MNEPTGKRQDNVPREQTPVYSKEFPKTPQERDRASSGHEDDEKAKQERPDPGANASPYGATNLHGTKDPSRFSTPPPKKP
jgi:hypothetical protein